MKAPDAHHATAQSVTSLRGVGPTVAERLARLGIERLIDLLLHLPTRYEDRTRVVPIAALRPGTRAVVDGEVQHVESTFRRRRTLLVALDDGSGARLTLRFFHFSRAQQASLSRGQRLRAFGDVRSGSGGGMEIVHPEYQLLRGEAAPQAPEHLTAMYPVTDGLGAPRLRALIEQALRVLARHPLPDPLAQLTALTDLPSLNESIRLLHLPPAETDLEALEAGRHPAQRRLAFEELLAHQLSQRLLRASLRTDPAPVIRAKGELFDRFIDGLSFSPTGAQRRVIEEIVQDLGDGQAMLRLVQGDVGSGKTLVALAASLVAVEAGFQVAMMAPTELLAEQHAISFEQWLRPLDVLSLRLTGRLKAAERRSALAALESGDGQVVVGTHALFQEQVEFARLGLVVIDEQHRFGVHQRLALREKGLDSQGLAPHQLVMTATPIPRTLAMSAYADLDTSIIDELPPGRTPVRTAAVPTSRRAELVARIAEQCRAGAQVYWVCPLIEESEHLNVSAAQVRAESLAEALPELRVMLLHGRMASAERTATMADFKAGRGDILVATTVIEVGVDVPNASLMIIENAERLGLAQLHQLRGRVGRGTAQSSCVLLYEPPLGQLSRARLDIMRRSNDGFEIAEKDLELRGPGEVLGTRQTGIESFRVAELVRDADLLPDARALADTLLAGDGEARATVTLLTDRWVGKDVRYGAV
ncbi:MAG: ATP-dependent DNA helicase RecG [Pseudomonadota bacterium]